MFGSTSLFIGTSFTVAGFTIFATSNVDSIVGIPHKIYSMQRISIHIKSQSLCLNVPICTQGMQRTWGPEAGTIIVTGPYYKEQGRFKNVYELLNLRALKISMLYKTRIFQCMGKKFCVEFQRVP